MEQSLFEKYGGFSKLNRLVIELYNRVLDSDEIGPIFENVDMAAQIDHQTQAIAAIMGGPATINDVSLRNAHSRLELTDAHFDELKSILSTLLGDFGLADQDAEVIERAFEVRRHLIVTK